MEMTQEQIEAVATAVRRQLGLDTDEQTREAGMIDSLDAVGGEWLRRDERRALVLRAVDGQIRCCAGGIEAIDGSFVDAIARVLHEVTS